MSANDAISTATRYLQDRTTAKPEAAAVVAALLMTEKTAKTTKQQYSLADLVGTWQLGFITGTRKARQQAAVALGAGRFLPRFLDIRIAYSQTEDGSDRGSVRNSVRIGPLEFALSGPIEFHPQTNILAFDFTYLTISMTDVELYAGAVRGGTEGDVSFYELPLKDRAFFTYFAIGDRFIAARGKGGGLALWTKTSPN